MITLLIVGSRLYGLVNNQSDTDYLAIISDGEEYPFPADKNIEVRTVSEFQESLNRHDLKALEVYFGYPNLFPGTIPVTYTFNEDSLRRAVSKVASNAHVKSKKKIRDGEIYIGIKSFWHCLRILTMYTDFAKNKTFNPRGYSEQLLNEYLDILLHMNLLPEDIFRTLDRKYDKRLKALLHEFRMLCPLQPKQEETNGNVAN